VSTVLPTNERERLDAIRRYAILDTPPDGAFDRIAALAARSFDVPIATVTIVDRDRIWFKAAHGIDVEEIGRDPGLCASAILQDDPYVVTDAISDARTLENPLVRGALQLRFYAAAPIKTREGYNLGTVNVIGREPREVTGAELETLEELAAIVVDELELRLAARRTIELERMQKEEAERLTAILQEQLLPQGIPSVPGSPSPPTTCPHRRSWPPEGTSTTSSTSTAARGRSRSGTCAARAPRPRRLRA
jgi:phosphoserine phosphatase RsbU/P